MLNKFSTAMHSERDRIFKIECYYIVIKFILKQWKRILSYKILPNGYVPEASDNSVFSEVQAIHAVIPQVSLNPVLFRL